MVGVGYHLLFLLLVILVTTSLGWEAEVDDRDPDTHYLRRNGFSLESKTVSLGNGTTISINYPTVTVHINSGGHYQQFSNTSLNYVFHINASSTVFIEGFRNISIYYLTDRQKTELRIAHFNTKLDRFNLTDNFRVKHMSDIDVNTSTTTAFINKIVSTSTTSSIITLPRSQVIFLTKMEPTYDQLTDYNFIINEIKDEHNAKPPLSKAMTAVVIICCTFAFMVGYYAYNKRLLIYRKIKTLIEYEDLLLYQIQVNVDDAEEDGIELPILSDEKIDKKVVKYLKKAAKVAETTQQADGNVVAIFADRNGEIVDVVKNQQAFVSYQMTKFGRSTINMQKGEEAVNEVKKMVEDNSARAKEEFLQVGSVKSSRGRKNRAAMKMFNAAPTDLSAVAPGVQEGVLQDVDEEEEDTFGAPEDTSPQMTRARGNAMVKLNPTSAAESTEVASKKGGSSSFDSTGSPKAAAPAATTAPVSNGTYNGTYNYSMTKSSKASPTTVASSVSTKEVKPSEMKSKKSASSSSSAAVSSSSIAAAAAAPLTGGLYYYPPTSSFATSEPSFNASTTAAVPSYSYDAPAPSAAVTETPLTTDYNAVAYGSAPFSTSFDLNTNINTGYVAPSAPLLTSSFDMSGIDTSGFSNYAAGGYDSQPLTAAYVPLSMDYNTSYLTSTVDNPYGTNSNAINPDYNALHTGAYAPIDTANTSYYDHYGNSTLNEFNNSQHAQSTSYAYGDANAYQGTVDYSGAGVSGSGGQYDYNSYQSTNQYATADTGGGTYQQYGSYNNNGYQ